MQNETAAISSSAITEQIIQQVLTAWHQQNKVVTDFFNKHSDDVYMKEVAPGRSRGIYLLGHLVAVNDGLLPLFALGDRLYPQLEKTFLAEADNATADMPSVSELKQYWQNVNAKLTEHFNKMTTEDWMSRHTRISPEDFAKEPTRNKLNVLLNRTSHQSYHAGQLVFLNPKN